MKSIIIAIILAPCMLWSCEHRCQDAFADADKAYCPAKPVETPMVEYDGHLWKAIMLEHHPDCGCEEEKEFEWPNLEESAHALEPAFY